MPVELVIIDLGKLLGCGDCFNCTDNRGLHCHECPNPKCNAVWQHPECSSYMGAHNCPRCGTESRWKMPLNKVLKIDFEWQGGFSE